MRPISFGRCLVGVLLLSLSQAVADQEALEPAQLLFPQPGMVVTSSHLTFRVVYKDEQADNVHVAARLRRPDGREQAVPLRDDGLEGDEAAGDGIWSATLYPPQPTGDWQLLFVKIAEGGRQIHELRGHRFRWMPDQSAATTWQSLEQRIGGLRVIGYLLMLVVAVLAAVTLALARTVSHRNRVDHEVEEVSEVEFSSVELVRALEEKLQELHGQIVSELSEVQSRQEQTCSRLLDTARRLVALKTDLLDQLPADDPNVVLISQRLSNLMVLLGIRAIEPAVGEMFDDRRHTMVTTPASASDCYTVTKLVEIGYEMSLSDGDSMLITPASVELVPSPESVEVEEGR